MNCPECNKESRVVDSRPCKGTRVGENYIRRRRECENGHRFTTKEDIERPEKQFSPDSLAKMKKGRLIQILTNVIADISPEAT
jgi:transcriptional regulator NrdR family protein